MQRIHIQFSGSLRVEDAGPILQMLDEAIKRRPEKCGAILRVRELGIEDADEVMADLGGILIPIDKVLSEP
jgi:hypothetical protein